MKQANLLFRYQTLDDMLLKYNKQKEESDKRKKLLKLKKYLIIQNRKLKSITSEVDDKNKVYRKISSVVEDLTYNLKGDHERLYSGEISDIKQLEHLQNNAERYKREINNKEEELINLIDQIKVMEDNINKIRVKMAKGKKEYMKINKLHKQEMGTINSKIDEIKDEMEKVEKKIEPELLKRYKNARKFKKIVVAKLKQNKCSGCNMTIPFALIDKLKNEDEIVECETCGRVICIE
ncbi:MAG: C4-type zinc ribbon domain-containing protein [Clostridia bacterium]|nr:C4-type zinc ribbon domain-containing protein [Clostridia bacterium]